MMMSSQHGEKGLGKSLRVLLVEDDPGDAELVVRRLAKEGFNLDWLRVDNEIDFLAALKNHYDLILSDWYIPGFSGLRALELLVERDSNTPFIIVSGNIGEEAAVAALRQGADDYLMKDRLERLGQAVRIALERKHSEEFLQMQSMALNAAANAIIITDVTGAIEWANLAFCALTGYTVDEAVGKNLRDLMKSGQHPPEFFAQMWDTITKGKAWHGEVINRRKNGSLYTEDLTITPLRNQEGQVVRFIAIKQDISEQKQAETSLRESEARFKAVSEYSHNAICLVDENGKIVWINKAFLDMGGYPAERIYKASSFLEFLAPESVEFVTGNFMKFVQREPYEHHYNFYFIRMDGQKRLCEKHMTDYEDRFGKRILAISMIDITEQRLAEDALRESEQRLRSLFNTTDQGIFESTPDGKMRMANQALAHIFGYDTPEAAIDGITDIAHGFYAHPDEREDIIRQVLQYPGMLTFENEYRRNDGSIFTGELMIQTMRDVKDQSPYIFGYIRDITERKRMERAIFLVAETQRQIARLNSCTEIFHLVGENIQKLIGDGYVTISVEDPQIEAMRVSELYGFGKIFDYLKRILRADPSKLVLYKKDMSDEHLRLFRSGKLQKFDAGLYNLLTCKIPRVLCEIAEKKFKMKNIYVIGMTWQDNDFGGASIFTQMDITPYQDMIESIMSQAAISIKRILAEEALKKSSDDLRDAYDATLQGWSKALELRERETAGHSQRVVRLTLKLSQALGIPEDELIHIHRGALLHDIGKMGIPDSILLKPEPLKEEEWVVMRHHPVYAYNLLSQIPYLKPALDIPYCHHEKWDGSGYPRGLKGEEIPLAARIFSIIDVWDALAYARPYRPAWTEETIIRYLKEQTGKQFDPRIVGVFLQLIVEDTVKADT